MRRKCIYRGLRCCSQVTFSRASIFFTISLFFVRPALGYENCMTHLVAQSEPQVEQIFKNLIQKNHAEIGKHFLGQHSVWDVRTNRQMGFIGYELSEDEWTIKDVFTHVDPKFRNRGISSLLYSVMVIENPHAQFIQSYLTGTNHEVFEKKVAEGFGTIAAIMTTPAYKSMAKVGFKNIIKIKFERTRSNSDIPKIYLVVSK